MLAKTHDAHTMLKNQRMFRTALTAANHASLTESAHTADFMQDALSFKLALNNVVC